MRVTGRVEKSALRLLEMLTVAVFAAVGGGARVW